jgi:hypothetical protein
MRKFRKTWPKKSKQNLLDFVFNPSKQELFSGSIQ